MIGLYGGTFDPVHYGHLRTAQEAVEALGLDELRFLPLNQPVHRTAPEASAAQRRAMLLAAIEQQPCFSVDETELKRGGPSFMVETIRSLRQEIGQRPIALLLGVDTFSQFLEWREPLKIADLCHLVVMTRPGYQLTTHGPLGALVAARRVLEPEQLRQKPGGSLFILPVAQLEISSSYIRSLLHNQKSPRYLLPDAVLELIQTQNLYQRR
jgi:nicotinate-nucleotide adenylyltransferase